MSQSEIEFPQYLESYGSFFSHLQNQFESMATHEKSEQKGNKFIEFALRVIPHIGIAQRFNRPEANKKKSHDKGVDIITESKDGSEIIFVQAKYTLRDVQEFDSILSKFQAYEHDRCFGSNDGGNLKLFNDEPSEAIPVSHFMIITISDVRLIKDKYERSQFASCHFYKKLQDEKRLHIIDGREIFPILKTAYKKQYVLPSDIKLQFQEPYMRLDNVYFGIVAASELGRIYQEFGNALFLENIREFLGQASGKISPSSSQITVNKEISRTLSENPSKFLARNNGITFRAGVVHKIDDSKLVLDEASIVNGCQTTMSVVENPQQGCFILVKIVESNDSWDIAEAANFQNEIRQLDLRLARYIRPQEIRKYTNKSSIGFNSQSTEASAFALLDNFYQNEISYDEVRALFIGIFSNTPNNAIDNNYTKIRSDIIETIFNDIANKERIFDILFKLHAITQESAFQIQHVTKSTSDMDLFKRFWSNEKPNYRSFLAILAASGSIGKNIFSEAPPKYEDVMNFLSKLQKVIDQKPELFIRYYRNAFLVVSFEVEKPDVNPEKIVQYMYTAIERSDFRNLYSRLQRMAQNDEKLVEIQNSFTI